MNIYIKGLFLGAALTGLTACGDYLNEQPEDKLIPETYFNDAANLQAYTLNFYTILPSHSNNAYGLGTFSSDNGTDNQATRSASSRWVPGHWFVPEGTDNWSFSNIRSLNFFFANAQEAYDNGEIQGNAAAAAQAMGEAHFFRAYSYWSYYSAVGDYPIIDGVLPDDKEVLLQASHRQPRNKVARYILEDLHQAANLLPEASLYGKNGLTKDCANLMLSRVALFEASWLKNHKGTALVPGGPGWPGDPADIQDFDIDAEIDFFFGEAMAAAKAVADKYVDNLVANTGVEEGMAQGFVEKNPYYCMFCVPDPSGYSEVLMYRSYALSQNQATQIQAQFQKNAGGTGWTRSMVNSFVMANGLPIYASGSGYDPEWENQGVSATLQGRDSRLQIFTKGDNSVISWGMDGNSPNIYRMGWALGTQGETCCPTGYAIKKGQGYDYAEATGNLQSITGSITFRAVEALLNYMEACVERTGAVDGDADKYWRAIRTRAKVDPDYMKTVAATDMSIEGELTIGDWGAYTRGALVSPLLYNVRRERRCELAAEAFRMMDLRRWAALDQLITNPYKIQGMKYWGTVYADENSPLCMKDEDGDFLPATVNVETGEGNMSPQSLGDYIFPNNVFKSGNLVWDGLTFTRAHYLSPIGHDAFVNSSVDKNDLSTSTIYQNPGWPVSANQPATNLD